MDRKELGVRQNGRVFEPQKPLADGSRLPAMEPARRNRGDLETWLTRVTSDSWAGRHFASGWQLAGNEEAVVENSLWGATATSSIGS